MWAKNSLQRVRTRACPKWRANVNCLWVASDGEEEVWEIIRIYYIEPNNFSFSLSSTEKSLKGFEYIRGQLDKPIQMLKLNLV